MEQEKKCCRCGEVKAVNDFYFEKRRNSFNAHCKICHNKAVNDKKERLISEGILQPPKYHNMKPAEKSKILDLYEEGIGSHKIAKIMGFAKCSVIKFLQRKGVSRSGATYRKHKFKNENFFDQIDSEEKAYFLGLLWADGCNYRRKDKKLQAYQISISLQEQDGYMVNRLAENIFGSTEIVRFVDNTNKKKQRIGPSKNIVKSFKNALSLRIPSKHMSDLLNSYGMTPRKSLTVEFPSVVLDNEKMFKSFVLGYLDGDGWISKHNPKNRKTDTLTFAAGVVGSHIFVRQLKELLGQRGFNFRIEQQGFISRLTIHGSHQTLNFLNWLYEDHKIKLERKYKIYLILKKQCEENPRSKLNRQKAGADIAAPAERITG